LTYRAVLWPLPAGGYHSLGLKADGSIIAWGYNYHGQCSVPSPNTGFVAIAAGYAHSLGLKSDGSIVAWGYNGSGQCNVPLPNRGFMAIATGGWYSLAIIQSCDYALSGDLNDDCRIDFDDFAKMASNWLIDCFTDPNNPACVPK
jgi:hypothetical protein